MNRFSLGYSHKNITAPSEKECIMAFLKKTEEVVKECVGKHSFTTTEMKLNKIIKLMKNMAYEPKIHHQALKGLKNELISLIKKH